MAKEVKNVEMLDDDVNRRILQTYIEDSRRSFREVARKVGVAPGTVVARMKQMEDAGLIDKYTIQINSDAVGYTLTAFVNVVMKEGTMLEPGHEITKFHEICGLYSVTGGSDALIVAKFRSREELNSFTRKLIKHPDVAKTRTAIALNTLKENFNSF